MFKIERLKLRCEMSVIEVEKLTKDYGFGRGVFDVSFKIDKDSNYELTDALTGSWMPMGREVRIAPSGVLVVRYRSLD